MSSTIEKVKDALHLNKDHKDHSATHNTHTNTTGHGVTHNNGVPEGTAGPHSSRVANAADPRVDSDLDSTRHNNHGVAGTGVGQTHGQPVHNSALLNKADPRVETGNTYGTTGSHNTGTHTGTSGLTGGASGVGHNHGQPVHNSAMLNKADPRVDTGNTGNNYGTTGTHGGISHSTNAGPHDSNIANKVDPRVDSDLDGRGNRHTTQHSGVLGQSGSHATAGSGTAQNTAGPHNSDMLNKLDPRVDSDRDGSKTYMGNATHQ